MRPQEKHGPDVRLHDPCSYNGKGSGDPGVKTRGAGGGSGLDPPSFGTKLLSNFCSDGGSPHQNPPSSSRCTSPPSRCPSSRRSSRRRRTRGRWRPWWRKLKPKEQSDDSRLQEHRPSLGGQLTVDVFRQMLHHGPGLTGLDVEHHLGEGRGSTEETAEDVRRPHGGVPTTEWGMGKPRGATSVRVPPYVPGSTYADLSYEIMDLGAPLWRPFQQPGGP